MLEVKPILKSPLIFGWNRLLFLFFLIIVVNSPIWLRAQSCDLSISGRILDESTGIALSFANVYVEESGQGSISDSLGKFEIKNLCPGDYHLRCSHIGCESERFFLTFQQDTSLIIYLHHHAELLDEVVVHGEAGANTSQTSNTISQKQIAEKSNENLANLLNEVAGVSTLKNGSGIAKPIIHGLYGNRVAILNNGIAQSGQQWGNDHAPEIDPTVADHLSVVKGASALAYNGSSLGGVVLVEAGPIQREPHLHGKVNYIFQSNGRGHTTNAQLERYSEVVAWKATGSFKRIGDRKTPNYFLNNTGNREANASLQLEKSFSPKWKSELYYSLFTSRLGILRGSHIGNLTDLKTALERSRPFFTEDEFSDDIEAPSQRVQHHLLKWSNRYFFNDRQVLNVFYGGQLNDRKEFDVRRGGRSDIPALSLQQFSHFVEANYQHTLPGDWTLKSGLQYRFVDNTNNPETGVLPLIPDYESQQGSAFFIANRDQEKVFYEMGLRYDYKNLQPATITREIPRMIERFDLHFHNLSAAGGLKYHFSPHWEGSFNLGYASRNPAINELFSNGLHQGVSGIEEGDPDLQSEHSLKSTLAINWNAQEKWFVQALGYFQRVNDFIYLQPQQEFRLTIRGAFPVFRYEQTNAQLFGLDFLAYLQASKNIRITAKYAYLNGQDLSNDLPLIFMPPNNLSATIDFSFPNQKRFKNSHLKVTNRYVFEQKNLEADQDFSPAPPAYYLLGLEAATEVDWHKSQIKIFTRVDNLLNTTYRDYLNRLRYFSDDIGTNIAIGLTWIF